MQVRPTDYQPSSLLHRRPTDPLAILFGLFWALGAHALVVVGAVAASQADSTDALQQLSPPQEIIEARLVRLGKKPDPRRMPKRKVPRKTTAPKESVAVSKNMEPKKPKKKRQKPPPEAEEDLLSRLGDRAQAFAEIADEQEREGDPEGDQEGTELEAQAGNKYAGQLTAFFKRGWTIPTTLRDTTKLVTVATVVLTRDLHVGPHRIIRSSGNPVFDQSVEDRFNQLRAQGTTLPEPPLAIAKRFLGETISIRFTDSSRRR